MQHSRGAGADLFGDREQRVAVDRQRKAALTEKAESEIAPEPESILQ